MKLFVRGVSLLALVVFVWYIAADRATPFTSNARVKAVVTPIIPKVAGTVIDIPAINSHAVEAGSTLLQLDRKPFELAVDKRRAELQQATQQTGASSAEVVRAQVQLSRTQAKLDSLKVQANRVIELGERKLIAKARVDEAKASLVDAEGAVYEAEAELERAKRSLGEAGNNNPKIQAALANLATAELELSYTKITAPADGGVVNLNIATGIEAEVGEPLMTFVDGRDIWIEAYMTENNISHIKNGDRVDVLLDTHPGKIFEGRVESVVSAAYFDDQGANGLPNPQTMNKWLRDPQRFPVRIVLPQYQTANSKDEIKLFLNGQADAIVYTSDNSFMNALGRTYIQIASWFSFLY